MLNTSGHMHSDTPSQPTFVPHFIRTQNLLEKNLPFVTTEKEKCRQSNVEREIHVQVCMSLKGILLGICTQNHFLSS